MSRSQEHATASDRDWVAVVAIANNGVIGRGDSLPWRLSSDLQRFKRLTMGHCLVMGRKTFDSIGKALPGRQTIVLSRAGCTSIPAEITVVSDVSEISRNVEPARRVMVVGGAQIYAATLALCSEMWLTRVLADVEGDTKFPEIDWSQWHQVSGESFPVGPKDDFPTEFQVWQRR
jgi:dihydrofolate reductase